MAEGGCGAHELGPSAKFAPSTTTGSAQWACNFLRNRSGRESGREVRLTTDEAVGTAGGVAGHP